MRSAIALLALALLVGCSGQADDAAASEAEATAKKLGTVNLSTDISSLFVYVDKASPYGGSLPAAGQTDGNGWFALKLSAGTHNLTFYKATSSHSIFVKTGTVTAVAGKTVDATFALRTQVDANHCEYWVDGFATLYTHNMGYYRRDLYSELRLSKYAERVGLWVRYKDNATGKVAETVALSEVPTADGLFHTVRFPYEEQPMGGGAKTDRTILDFAYFMDAYTGSPADSSLTPARIWMSNRGANFQLASNLAPPTYPETRGLMEYTWANQNVPVFDQKRACKK